MSTEKYEDDAELDAVESVGEYSGRAALDSSGVLFNLLGKDTDGYGSYHKQSGESGEIVVLDGDEDVIEYRREVGRGQLESYVWEKEWEVLTGYGEHWLPD